MSKLAEIDRAQYLRECLDVTRAGLSPVQLAESVCLAFRQVVPGKTRDEKLALAMIRGLPVREKMAAEEGGSLSADETARYLGVTKQSVLNLYHSDKLLAWRTEKQGALRFPVWQFAENRRLPGLVEVLAKLNACTALDDWGKVGFFLQTHGLLEDRRPLDLLRENRIDLVLKAAEAYVE
jgi:hypothetical protein